MGVVGPRQPRNDDGQAGRALAPGLAARVGGHVRAHSAAYAVALAVVSVAWGLQQVG
jgi:hypothetical protein